MLIGAAGGAIVNLGDPRLRVDVPANAFGFNIRMSVAGKAELSAADLALTTAAFAAQADTFVSTIAMQVAAVRDSNPNLAAGAGQKKVTVSLPFGVDVSSRVTVGGYGPASILVPFSVMRVFKLNRATSRFEAVLDGTNLPNLASGLAQAEVGDPDGIYALGAPPYTPLVAGSSGTVATSLPSGATATVEVPFGSFASATTLALSVPGASGVPALPALPGLAGTGVTVSIQTTGGVQPVRPVTVRIGYRPADVAGIEPTRLKLARYDAATGWQILESSVDTQTRQVSADTDHFSLFQIVAVTPAATLADGFVFPNPFRPSLGHTRLKFSSLTAGAHVKIFSVSGRLLKELDADATGQILSWDGTDRDGRKLPSGVYLAVAESDGKRRTVKFAIQR